MREAVELIKSCNDILILTHKNPDGDAIGSVLALSTALLDKKKKVVCYSNDEIPKIFDFLPNASIIKNETFPQRFDLVVLLDCFDLRRTGIDDSQKVFSSYENLLVIDHHPGLDESGKDKDGYYIVEPKASSTAILVFDLLQEMNIVITKDIANCILTGIFTDTGSFQHSNTDVATLEVAGELMKKGSRVDKIARQIFNNKTIPAIKLWGKALSRIRTDVKTGMAVSYLNKNDLEEYDVSQEELSGLVGIINTISDSKFSLLLTEMDDKKIKGSLRSEEYKGIDVSKIARSLGGGGHRLASGFEMEGEMKDSISRIKEAIIKSGQRNWIKNSE